VLVCGLKILSIHIVTITATVSECLRQSKVTFIKLSHGMNKCTARPRFFVTDYCEKKYINGSGRFRRKEETLPTARVFCNSHSFAGTTYCFSKVHRSRARCNGRHFSLQLV